MTVLKIKDIISSMTKKGFKLDVDGKHKRLIYMHNGKISSIVTHYSHSSDQIGDFLIRKMADQIKISKKQFLQLIECTLSADGYLQLVKYIIQE